eukprot:gene52434-70117_t
MPDANAETLTHAAPGHPLDPLTPHEIRRASAAVRAAHDLDIPVVPLVGPVSLLLALAGLLASFIPGLSRLELDPEIILTVVLPPLLFSAATEFSFVAFLKRLGSIVNLGVILVAVTTGVVASVASAAVPGMSIAVALVLGAVISPPDAVTAVAVGRRLGLPDRMMTVLKGESLINDAAALTLFTFATARVAGTPLFIDSLPLFLAYSAVAGVVIGVVMVVLTAFAIDAAVGLYQARSLRAARPARL